MGADDELGVIGVVLQVQGPVPLGRLVPRLVDAGMAHQRDAVRVPTR